ncbi:aldo/keto reductase [Halolamina salifodinae]|uniref:Diketogulonate reductase-like aldo/keto reductase n=1 Tax=Halolamina salifodinae TaxID=1202767 RepID=A0A8T4H3U4_9EURY|nr:aldo/keto reductase [Halolamina salifodinae]MBP1987848.1 diketogulonate reductase-like aldo/keto reductase [Halolamina salifodinae]
MQGIPRLGFGTYENDDPEQCAESVRTALEVGYRHVDTAQSYGNESAVGDGIAASDVDAEDVFVATKLATGNLAYEDAVETAHESVERLGVDSIDLLYVHWPINSYDPEGTIEALNDLYEDGVIEAVGLSNFRIDQLDAAIERLDPPLAAHQVECHPMLPQEDLRAHAVDHDYALVAYCPIARNQVAEIETIQDIAAKHDASPAQVSLAWLLEKENLVAIPKATSEAHIRDNWGAQELELDEEDVAAIDGIDERRRIVDFDAAPWNQ